MLLDHSITREDGQLQVPCRATPDGFVYDCKGDGTATTKLRIYELAHLYHASMSREDYDIICRVRDGDKERDWNKEEIGAVRAEWYSEYSRFQYYDGKNPDWPEKALPRAVSMRGRVQCGRRRVEIASQRQTTQKLVEPFVGTPVAGKQFLDVVIAV